MLLNASVAHLAATQYVAIELQFNTTYWVANYWVILHKLQSKKLYSKVIAQILDVHEISLFLSV